MAFGIRRRSPHSTNNPFMNGNSVMVPRYTTPPSRNTAEWIKAFETSPRLAVIMRIASDLSFAEGKLYRVDDDGDEQEVTAHRFLDFWKNPNPLPEMSKSALWYLQEIYLMLKGEGCFIVERDAFGFPAEYWPIPTHWIQMTPYLGHPFYTVRLTNGTLMNVPVDDMFIMKDLTPFDPYKRGLGQAEPLADEIEIDEYAAKFQKKFFFNDATPNLIIGMPKSTDDQRKRFRMEWMERFKGVFKSHGVATVNGEVMINKVGENMKDMDFVGGREYIRNAVLEHFGMPREIMGITESSNRATSDAAQFIYAQNVLMPKLRRRENAINQQILPYFGENLIYRFDDIVPRNQEFDKARGLEGWNSGLITRDEGRELIGMPAAKTGGNVYKVQFSDMFIGEDEDPVTATAQSANLQFGDTAPLMEPASDTLTVTNLASEGEEEPSKGRKSAAEVKATERKAARLQAVQRGLDAARKEEAHRFEVAVSRYFKEQTQRISNTLGGTTKADRTVWDILTDAQPEYGLENGGFIALDELERSRLVDQFVLNLVDWEGESKTLESLFSPLWRESYDKGADVAQKLYGLASVQRPELVSLAKIQGGKRVKYITETTKTNISRIVSNGLDAGESNQTLAKAIQEEMNTSAGRARVIASQECNASLNAGNVDMMRKAGASMKTWHVTNVTKARDSHKALNGKTVPINEPFVTINGVKIMYPCDPNCGNAGEVVSCHCFLTYDD